jgi:hypothetical protein
LWSLILIRTIYWPLGRSVAGLLAAVQELEHLGVGFVSLTEELDPATPAGRTMAGLPAIIFAEFDPPGIRPLLHPFRLC